MARVFEYVERHYTPDVGNWYVALVHEVTLLPTGFYGRLRTTVVGGEWAHPGEFLRVWTSLPGGSGFDYLDRWGDEAELFVYDWEG